MPSYVRGRQQRRVTDAEIIRLYVDAGMDADAIGFQAGCSGTTVLNIVRAAGHPIRNPGRGAPRAKRIPDDEIVRRYLAGQSGPLLAQIAGCTAGTVYRVLRDRGVEIRPSASTAKATAAATKARQQRKTPPRG